jgi:hypothetical protein
MKSSDLRAYDHAIVAPTILQADALARGYYACAGRCTGRPVAKCQWYGLIRSAFYPRVFSEWACDRHCYAFAKRYGLQFHRQALLPAVVASA